MDLFAVINALFPVVEKYENILAELLLEESLHHFPVHPEAKPALSLA